MEMQKKEKITLSSEHCLEGLQQIRQIHQTVRTKQILSEHNLSCTMSEMGYILGSGKGGRMITYDCKLWA